MIPFLDRMTMLYVSLLLVGAVPTLKSTMTTTVSAFDISTRLPTKMIVKQELDQQLRYPRKFQWRTKMAINPNDDSSNNYDMSKPIYDLYALRMVRSDAILRYNLRNQSEPLRINLALIGTLFFLCLPTLVSEFSGASNSVTVVPTTMPLVTPDLTVTIPQTISSWLGAVGCFAFGIQQSQKRNKQLLRIEKECFAGDLCIQLPMTWIASDRPYQTNHQSIRNVIKNKSCRIIALSGPTTELLNILQNELIIYNRRWKQSNTYWVLIPTDVPVANEQRTFVSQIRYPWLAQAYDYKSWNIYFQSLQRTTTVSTKDLMESKNDIGSMISWFGLSANGRSFGSGTTKPTSYLQILGNSLSPVDILYNDVDDKSNEIKGSENDSTEMILLSCQQRFYDALTNGNLEAMRTQVFDDEDDDEVSKVMQDGGRLDTWDACLMEDAKPTGMSISDREVILLPGDDSTNQITTTTTAYTTCIEFPVDTYMGGVIPTLLAVQKWKRKEGSVWKLVQHQTIPWTSERAAGGTLICDCRGCVALVRSTSTSTR